MAFRKARHSVWPPSLAQSHGLSDREMLLKQCSVDVDGVQGELVRVHVNKLQHTLSVSQSAVVSGLCQRDPTPDPSCTPGQTMEAEDSFANTCDHKAVSPSSNGPLFFPTESIHTKNVYHISRQPAAYLCQRPVRDAAYTASRCYGPDCRRC